MNSILLNVCLLIIFAFISKYFFDSGCNLYFSDQCKSYNLVDVNGNYSVEKHTCKRCAVYIMNGKNLMCTLYENYDCYSSYVYSNYENNTCKVNVAYNIRSEHSALTQAKIFLE